MDMFTKLVDVNRKRTEDTPVESAVLEAMRASKRGNGEVEELVRRLPSLKKFMIYQAVGNLAARRKIELLPGERWKLKPS